MKRFLAAALLIVISAFAVFSLSACASGPASEGDVFASFTDSEGRTVSLYAKPERVVSLQGSFAETWLVAGGELVGVTSDATEDLALDVGEATSVGTVKEPDAETLLSLNPDFVIMSSDIAGHKAVASLLDSLRVPYGYFKQETFEDYLDMLGTFTSLTEKPENFLTYGTALQTRIENVRAQAQARTEKPEVLFVRARSQGVSAKASDHMVCTILHEFGCVNIAAVRPSLLENLSVEEILKQDPDIILVTFMGDQESATQYLEKNWESNPAWSGLTAVRQDRYEFLQKNLFHFKPNARWADAYETLYEILFE